MQVQLDNSSIPIIQNVVNSMDLWTSALFALKLAIIFSPFLIAFLLIRRKEQPTTITNYITHNHYHTKKK